MTTNQLTATQVYVLQRNQELTNSKPKLFYSLNSLKQDLADQIQELREFYNQVTIITPIEEVERSLNSLQRATFYVEIKSPYLQSVTWDLTLTTIQGDSNDN